MEREREGIEERERNKWRKGNDGKLTVTKTTY